MCLCVGVTFIFACSLDKSGRCVTRVIPSRHFLLILYNLKLSMSLLDKLRTYLTLGDAHFVPINDLVQREVGSDMVCSNIMLQCTYSVCMCVYMHLLVLWSSCLAAKFLISKYLATRRVAVSGRWGNGFG